MFWKKKGFDYNSPEFRAIDAGALMIGETMKKCASPHNKVLGYSHALSDEVLHYTYSTFTHFRIADHISMFFSSETLQGRCVWWLNVLAPIRN